MTAPRPPIRFVIFDLDNVLVQFQPQRRLDYLASLTGLTPQHLHDAIWGSDFESAAEAGAYADPDAYLAEFNRRISLQISVEQWIAGRRAAMQLRPEVLGIARELQGRVGLAVLTNNGSLLKRSLPELVPEVCALFGTSAHASYEFNSRKPDVAVYQRLLQRYGVDPASAVHIDDDAEYVKGAIAAGLNAVTFHSARELRESLPGLGLAID
ncbi:MAG TPA: HAD family phosphatase [Povalibacter sp.]|nr:HAD family phosphatase [Povalibacter sp.]